MGHLPLAVLEAAIESDEHERRYTSSKHAIELLAKDEDSRKLRTDIFLLEDDIEELHDQLQHEQDSADRVRSVVDEHLTRAQHAEAALEVVERTSYAQKHDIARLQAEIASSRNTNEAVDTVLAEKLALARELSILRPEVQHLRAQAASIERLVQEKLALQRQLADTQCEVESARTEAKRAQAKRRNTTMEIAQEAQVEELKKELAREKRARANAEEIADQAQSQMNVDDVRRELAKEKKLRERLEEELESAKENTQIEDVRRDLLRVKKAKQKLEDQNESLQEQLEREQKTTSRAVQRLEGDSESTVVITELRDKLAAEKAGRAKDEKSVTKKEEQWELDKTALDDKLNQFRVKLRETKELLKTTKEELAAVTERAVKAEQEMMTTAVIEAVIKTPAKKPTNKRTAKVLVPSADETSLGTPGDGPQAKRIRKANAAIGSKSSFSITPFLNKTAVVDVEDDAQQSESEPTPAKNASPTKVPLNRAASIKGNSKLGKANDPLARVAEEDAGSLAKADHTRKPLEDLPPDQTEEPSDSVEPVDKHTDKPTATAKPKPATKSKAKPRKSLVDFETFQKLDSEPVVKQKKRKLGGGGPTLFDEDDNGADSGTKSGFAGRSLLRSTPGNRLMSIKKTGLLTAKNSRSGLINANDGSGFQFSPLRRIRKNLDDTLRG